MRKYGLLELAIWWWWSPLVIVDSLVIGCKVHDFFQYWWGQPWCEGSNMQQISKHYRIHDPGHWDLLHWKCSSDKIIIQFPVDFNRRDGCVRQNGWIRVQIECQPTDECCKAVARSRLDAILMDIVSICQTVDELQCKSRKRKPLNFGSARAGQSTWNLLDRWPRSWAEMQSNSNSIVWKIYAGYSSVALVSDCNCTPNF